MNDSDSDRAEAALYKRVWREAHREQIAAENRAYYRAQIRAYFWEAQDVPTTQAAAK
jgi:hypothetical protein